MPGFAALNFLTSAVLSPDVSLPMQRVTSPFALFIDAGSMTLAPSILGAEPPPPEEVVHPPPPPPPPPPLSLPQAATTPPPSRAATKIAVRRLDTSSPSSCYAGAILAVELRRPRAGAFCTRVPGLLPRDAVVERLTMRRSNLKVRRGAPRI